MKVRYSKRAVDDLIAVADNIRPTDLSIYNPSAAEAVEKRIRASIARLSIFPFIGRATDDSVIRVLPITRYPYLVFYEVLGEEIVITTFATVAARRSIRALRARSSTLQ